MSAFLMSVLMLAPPVPAETKEEPAFVLPTDRRYASHLDAIREHAAKKDWAVATTLVQKLLDLDEDVFVSVRRLDNSVTVSLRAEAERRLLELPAEGRAFYQQEYGPKAADLLQQGRMFNDERMLVLTVRRYFQTEAGLEACERLALDLLNRGHSSAAAVHFKRVLERIPPEKLTATTLQKAALAFRRAGDGPRFDLVWRALAAKPGVKVEEVRKEIEQQAAPTPRPRKDWPMFRGDPSRNASAAAGVPVLEPLWKVKLSEADPDRSRAVDEWLDKSIEALRTKNQAVLPAQQPLTLALPRDTGVFALSLYRSFWGEHARALHRSAADEVQAGEIFWEAPSLWSLDCMLKDSYVGFLNVYLNRYIEEKARPGVLFENTSHGTFSTDGRHLFVIEDLQVPPGQSRERALGPRAGGRLGEALEHNWLQGYDQECTTSC